MINLRGAYLFGANLRGVNLTEANLIEADLSGSNLRGAYFKEANLRDADLRRANLNDVNLTGANLGGANLEKATFANANLIQARFHMTNLNETNFYHATLGETTFSEVDLRDARELETILHLFSSVISTDTIKGSEGKIPERFLLGCGLSDWEIESTKLYRPNLSNEEINSIVYKLFDLRAQQSIQISPLFISYSHADAPLVEKLEKHLTKLGVRFWRDIHNATAGRLETQIDRAMRQNPTVLLILSQNSTASDWVEHEAHLARQLEKEIGRDVLCPIALDDSWKSAKWPARLMEQIMEYNILDFSNWQDTAAFEKTFNKMINGLDVFYKK